jgi:CHAT domain-containing protein
VTRDSLRLIELPWRDSDLPARIVFFLETLRQPPSGAAAGTAHPETRAVGGDIDRMGASVYRQLFGAIDDLIQRASKIVVAPDSYLSAVPFGALPLPAAGDGRRLMDVKEVEFVPSAAVLSWLRGSSGRTSNEPGGNPIVVLVPRGDRRLHGVAREVDALRRDLSGVRVISGKPELSALQAETGSCEVLHVAAHVGANDEKPWFSGILLGRKDERGRGERPVRSSGAGAGIDADVPSDPYLRAGDIVSLRINARLAVLAGCETALGRMTSGEGVLGLTSAFLTAGIPAVLSTLWPVDDEATADLMSAFYDGLAAGETVATALGNAQAAIRARRATAAPFYWAGFVVVGNGATRVAVERRSRFTTTGLTVAAAVALFTLLLLRRRRQKKRPAV